LTVISKVSTKGLRIARCGEESGPIICPKFGKELYFDKDFYFEYGAMGISKSRSAGRLKVTKRQKTGWESSLHCQWTLDTHRTGDPRKG